MRLCDLQVKSEHVQKDTDESVLPHMLSRDRCHVEEGNTSDESRYLNMDSDSEDRDSSSSSSSSSDDHTELLRISAEPRSLCQAPCWSYNRNRLLRIMALATCFERHDLRHLEPLLQLVWAYLDMKPVWQVETNSGGWIDCDDVVQRSIHDAQSRGEAILMVHAATWNYTINLNDLTQTNTSTQRVRKLRCCDPFSSEYIMATAPAALGPRWQFQCGHGWADCESDFHRRLEAAREGHEQTFTCLGPAGFELLIDMQALTQTNTGTGRVRQLRRLS